MAFDLPPQQLNIPPNPITNVEGAQAALRTDEAEHALNEVHLSPEKLDTLVSNISDLVSEATGEFIEELDPEFEALPRSVMQLMAFLSREEFHYVENIERFAEHVRTIVENINASHLEPDPTFNTIVVDLVRDFTEQFSDDIDDSDLDDINQFVDINSDEQEFSENDIYIMMRYLYLVQAVGEDAHWFSFSGLETISDIFPFRFDSQSSFIIQVSEDPKDSHMALQPVANKVDGSIREVSGLGGDIEESEYSTKIQDVETTFKQVTSKPREGTEDRLRISIFELRPGDPTDTPRLTILGTGTRFNKEEDGGSESAIELFTDVGLNKPDLIIPPGGFDTLRIFNAGVPLPKGYPYRSFYPAVFLVGENPAANSIDTIAANDDLYIDFYEYQRYIIEIAQYGELSDDSIQELTEIAYYLHKIGTISETDLAIIYRGLFGKEGPKTTYDLDIYMLEIKTRMNALKPEDVAIEE